MKKVLFIDRDGTLIKEPEDQQIDAFQKLEFLPGALSCLARIALELDYELVMVTNQDGLGTDSFPEDDFWPVHNLMLKILEGEGIQFSAVHIDRSFASEGLPTRKPGTGLLQEYIKGDYDLAGSYVIGDRYTDMELAVNLGARGLFIDTHPEMGAEEVTTNLEGLSDTIAWRGTSWKEIYTLLKMGNRTGEVHRKTAETDVSVFVKLDGSGKAEIDTGLKFFDHMLDQLARHGQMDVRITTKGDLEVDEHHTIEDTAIALGEAFSQAVGNKLGIERYGFCLPMDDCLAQVALDFGGRSWLVWDADFKREKIGDMPTEMFLHFFKSFADSAKANINIQASGTNEHHKIEAIFKAFAKAIKHAVKRDPDHPFLPSTKGVL